MEEEKAYEIFTDASFDDVTKVGTYAIVIMQENKMERRSKMGTNYYFTPKKFEKTE